MGGEGLSFLPMGDITRPRPALVKTLALALLAVGVAGAVGIVSALFEQSYLAAHLEQARAAATIPAELDRAASEVRGSARLATVLGGLALLGLLCAWLTYDVRPKARLLSLAVGTVTLVGNLLLMTQNVTASYLADGVGAEQLSLVNSLIKHPAFSSLLFAVEVVCIVGGIVIFVLCLHVDVKEYLKIRLEPPKDAQWERALEVRRAAVEVERDNA